MYIEICLLISSLFICHSNATEATSSAFIKHTGKQCTGDKVLAGYVGSAEECQWKCLDLGIICCGFVRVNSGNSNYNGKCYFRGGTLTIDSTNYPYDNRDCFERSSEFDATIYHDYDCRIGEGEEVERRRLSDSNVLCQDVGEDCIFIQDGADEYCSCNKCNDFYNIVIENVGGYIQAGFSGDSAPKIIDFRSIVGRPKPIMVGMGSDEPLFGEDAWNNRGFLDLTYPMMGDIVSDEGWDDMEALWGHIFYDELKINPKYHCFMISEPPLNPKTNREKMTQIMFETFNVPCFYTVIDAVAALFASGRTTGIVLEIHEDVSWIVPIYEGYALPHAIMALDVGVVSLVEYMSEMLSFTTTTEKDYARDILNKFGYAASHYDEELQKADTTTEIQKKYTLPDGSKITMNYERFKAIEALFKPIFIGREVSGVHHLIYESIMKCDVDIRKELYANVVLAGSGTIYSGIDTRLKNELQALAPSSATVKVISPPERKYSAWIGGSILSSLSSFQEMWIDKDEYDESGPSIVHRKCFAKKGETINLIENGPFIGVENMNDKKYYLRINKIGCLGLIVFVLSIFIISIWNMWKCYTMLNEKTSHSQYDDEVRMVSDTD